jgi:hypothetical protein
MPKATKKNLYLDRPSQSRGYMSGIDKTWTGEDVNTHIEKWMRDMGLLTSESEIPKSGLISECTVIGGSISADIILAKNRDRKQHPTVSIVRKQSSQGVEMLLMIDKTSKYVEGMNEFGVGILNSTLSNQEDARVYTNYNQRQGSIIHRALCCESIDEAIGIIATHSGGLEGHTFIGDSSRLYLLELKQGQEAIVTQLDPTSGWDARTNHGIQYSDAGYMPRDGKSYMSSMHRQALAEVELNAAENEKEVLKILRQQHYDTNSTLNLFQRRGPESPDFQHNTTSQILLNLSKLTVYFHYYPEFVDYQEVKSYLPEDYEPKIELVVSKSKG